VTHIKKKKKELLFKMLLCPHVTSFSRWFVLHRAA
jgi:hypothetical protein